MRSFLCILLSVLMLLPLLAACSPDGNDPNELYGTPISEALFSASALLISCETAQPTGRSRVLAGACTHEGLLYYAVQSGDGQAKICRRPLTDDKVKEGPVQSLGKAVSMCYNTTENKLIVAHGDTTLSVVDPETLEVVSTATTSREVAAITYYAAEGIYLARSANQAALQHLDAQFKQQRISSLPDGLKDLPLGDVTCDGKYVYLLITKQISPDGKFCPGLLMYDPDAKTYYRNTFDHVLNEAEATSLSVCGSVFLVGLLDSQGDCFISGTPTPAGEAQEPADLLSRSMGLSVDSVGFASVFQFDVYSIAGKPGPNNVLQGGCTDDRYGYYCMEDQANNYSETSLHRTCIVKVDLTDNTLVKVSDPLPLDHSNDMCYNAKLNKLVVVHCGKGSAARKLSFLDPDTLEITDSAELPFSIFSMAYEPVSDRYVVGLGGGRDFAILDGELNVLVSRYSAGSSSVYCNKTTLLTQGADCDSQYIYFVQSGRNDNEAWTNYFVVYDWNGSYIGAKILPDFDEESENISHIGTSVYIGCNGGNDPVYRIDISR